MEDEEIQGVSAEKFKTYRVTQNKVHHLLVILYLIFDVNFTQVSYDVQCILSNEVQFNEVQFLKYLSERNISNCAVRNFTVPFKILGQVFQNWTFTQ